MNEARTKRQKIFVFFTATGNRAASQYESGYFTDPSVRSVLDQFVLVKVDFPRSTQLGYRLGIYGAGMIAITDPNGTKLGSILSMPASPQDFARQVQSIQ